MEWKEILFDDFCRLNRGFDLPNNNIVEGDVPVVAFGLYFLRGLSQK
jgi:hypothetical protein